jgi:hypothetical protein
MRKEFIFTICLLWLPVAIAVADPIYVESVASVSGEADMVGMKVAVGYNDPSDQTKNWHEEAIWSVNSAGELGAFGNGWNLICPWSDTFWSGNPQPFPIWTLSSDRSLSWFQIEALPGKTVFDIYWDLETDSANNESTLGSERGYWGPNYEDSSSIYGHSSMGTSSFGSWCFSDQVALGSTNVVGDLYGTLKLDFTTPQKKFEFEVDTDAVIIPEPASMLLMGCGLLVFAGYSARRSREKIA